ncbi:solute carrier family 30 (zinc transporter), member 2 [Nematocida sp. LUAm3]|nr:solute carrier family 30 (zinc transporter), member 2 [Nematocida sp. LUAm3]KAI5174060.1 solute carrier family 30 (zinc transporter), member 2 [Nematocida sp. LUAm2]KAI5177197.1 solute carrier family 30 (zinc transporter), member 2 [Nematocida sp. LUAm1]
MKYANSAMYIILFNTVLLLTVEIIAHYKSNAVSVLGEAFHMLSDLTNVLLNIISSGISHRYKGGKRCTFGLKRLEVISSGISVILIWIPAATLVYISLGRLMSPQPIDKNILMGASGFSLFINIVNFAITFWLNRHTNDMNVTSLYIHALTDLSQALGMCLAAIVLYINEKWVFIDFLCALFSAAICFGGSFSLFRDVIRILMDISPVDPQDVHNVILGVPGVSGVDDLKIWSLTRKEAAVMGKISIFKGESFDKSLFMCKEALMKNYDFSYINIEQTSG